MSNSINCSPTVAELPDKNHTLPMQLQNTGLQTKYAEEEQERSCWICLGTSNDNRAAAWVQPCKCCGSTKWVHQKCLNRWIDEKQKDNPMQSISCPQCLTKYVTVNARMPKLAHLLELMDKIFEKLSTYIGIYIGDAFSCGIFLAYGAIAFLQMFGLENSLALIENGGILMFFLGIPIIPLGLLLLHSVEWEDAILQLIRNKRNSRRMIFRNLDNEAYDESEEEEEENEAGLINPPIPVNLSDAVLHAKFICGALLLPTFSSFVGNLLFDWMENNFYRTLLGGLTFIFVKGLLNIYMKYQQFIHHQERLIVDYNRESAAI